MIFGLPSDNFGADFVSFWMKFTVTVNFLLCCVCSLGAICGRFRRVFGSFAVRGVVTTHKTREGRVISDERVPQIALVSQSSAENRHENTVFINPIILTSYSDFTVIALVVFV